MKTMILGLILIEYHLPLYACEFKLLGYFGELVSSLYCACLKP
ncbi:hypothetical protein HPHPA11_0982 [Helicobacter pylori Hp A-11]|uniref:Uncharacterized protein n=1 Tax=Helicobacter pylori Hp A-11 TaxID=992035 RepID=N4TT30_HELPX|nr:hypothetical protein HPHPA11_0982 [Helicobacter pylori Hp A-11]